MRSSVDDPIFVTTENEQNGSLNGVLDKICNADPSMIFVVSENNRGDKYSIIKTKTLVQRSIPSQVYI